MIFAVKALMYRMSIDFYAHSVGTTNGNQTAVWKFSADVYSVCN